MFRGALLVQVQAEQDRQAVVVTPPERQLDDLSQHDPTVSPVGHYLAAAGEKRIVMHARTEHLQAAFASQRVVVSHDDHVSQKRLYQIKPGEPYRIERPTGRAEQSMVRQEMFSGHIPRRHDRSRYRMQAVA